MDNVTAPLSAFFNVKLVLVYTAPNPDQRALVAPARTHKRPETDCDLQSPPRLVAVHGPAESETGRMLAIERSGLNRCLYHSERACRYFPLLVPYSTAVIGTV